MLLLPAIHANTQNPRIGHPFLKPNPAYSYEHLPAPDTLQIPAAEIFSVARTDSHKAESNYVSPQKVSNAEHSR